MQISFYHTALHTSFSVA